RAEALAQFSRGSRTAEAWSAQHGVDGIEPLPVPRHTLVLGGSKNSVEAQASVLEFALFNEAVGGVDVGEDLVCEESIFGRSGPEQVDCREGFRHSDASAYHIG